MNVVYENMPCYDPGALDVEDGVHCGAFEQYVANETLRFVPRATTHDGLLAERRQLLSRLHEEFVEAGFCLLARAFTAEVRVDVSIHKNAVAGTYGECPYLVEHRQARQN